MIKLFLCFILLHLVSFFIDGGREGVHGVFNMRYERFLFGGGGWCDEFSCVKRGRWCLCFSIDTDLLLFVYRLNKLSREVFHTTYGTPIARRPGPETEILMLIIPSFWGVVN